MHLEGRDGEKGPRPPFIAIVVVTAMMMMKKVGGVLKKWRLPVMIFFTIIKVAISVGVVRQVKRPGTQKHAWSTYGPAAILGSY
jgi:hypothetical protein